MPPLPLRAATIDQERLLFKLFRQDYTFANLPREENLDRWENCLAWRGKDETLCSERTQARLSEASRSTAFFGPIGAGM
jgi:hypothetical protein